MLIPRRISPDYIGAAAGLQTSSPETGAKIKPYITVQVTILARMVKTTRMIMYGMASYDPSRAMTESDRP